MNIDGRNCGHCGGHLWEGYICEIKIGTLLVGELPEMKMDLNWYVCGSRSA